MTDEQFVYQQEQRERASTARGAHYKKGHTGKGGCTLPNSNLSRREWMKKNGEVKTMDPHKFYTYDEFKKFSDYLKVEYLNYLCEKYKVGITTIDQVVFNAPSRSRLCQHLGKNGLLDSVNPKGYRSHSGRQKLEEDIRAARQTENSAQEPVSMDMVATTHTNETPKTHKGLTHCDITMNALDISFIQFIVHQFDGRPIRIRLEIAEEEVQNA